jgi:DNA-binding response OmpR family regulator
MPPPTVLVVEDDPVILRLLEVNFEMEGFRVLLAHDGSEGIEMARSESPDVVVTDVMMPGTSGLDLLRAVKNEAATAHVPVLLLSAKAQAADVEGGLEAGADDYVTKPFEPVELVDRVNALLHR